MNHVKNALVYHFHQNMHYFIYDFSPNMRLFLKNFINAKVCKFEFVKYLISNNTNIFITGSKELGLTFKRKIWKSYKITSQYTFVVQIILISFLHIEWYNFSFWFIYLISVYFFFSCKFIIKYPNKFYINRDVLKYCIV